MRPALLLAVLLPGFQTGVLLGQPAAPPVEEPVWSGSLALAYLATGGNSETETVGLDLAAKRRPLPWGLELMASLHRAETEGARTAERVCREAVQILGGMGYMRETRVERLSRDARLLDIGGGTHEIMNEIASRALLP